MRPCSKNFGPPSPPLRTNDRPRTTTPRRISKPYRPTLPHSTQAVAVIMAVAVAMAVEVEVAMAVGHGRGSGSGCGRGRVATSPTNY